MSDFISVHTFLLIYIYVNVNNFAVSLIKLDCGSKSFDCRYSQNKMPEFQIYEAIFFVKFVINAKHIRNTTPSIFQA